MLVSTKKSTSRIQNYEIIELWLKDWLISFKWSRGICSVSFSQTSFSWANFWAGSSCLNIQNRKRIKLVELSLIQPNPRVIKTEKQEYIYLFILTIGDRGWLLFSLYSLFRTDEIRNLSEVFSIFDLVVYINFKFLEFAELG